MKLWSFLFKQPLEPSFLSVWGWWWFEEQNCGLKWDVTNVNIIYNSPQHKNQPMMHCKIQSIDSLHDHMKSPPIGCIKITSCEWLPSNGVGIMDCRLAHLSVHRSMSQGDCMRKTSVPKMTSSHTFKHKHICSSDLDYGSKVEGIIKHAKRNVSQSKPACCKTYSPLNLNPFMPLQNLSLDVSIL
jgi:hypothetical protein